MQYAYPQLIALAAALAGVVVGLVALAALRRRWALCQLAAAPDAGQLLVSRPRRLVRAFLLVTAGGLLGFAILGPQWGETADESAEPPAAGRDVLILLDVSRSMLAEDVAPNRLTRAKADIRDLVSRLERAGGYRVGLIGFADRAVILCPLTTDYRCFEDELTRLSLDTLRARGDTGDAGTQIGLALHKAAGAIDPAFAASTDILLISDGGDMEPDTVAAALDLGKMGVTVHTVGLGNPTTGAPIPVVRADGRRSLLQHKGETVTTRLEEEVLRQVAARTGGQYLSVGTGFVELDRWYDGLAGAKVEREAKALARPTRQAIHRFQWFLLPAVVLLVLHQALSESANGAGPAEKGRYFIWLRRRRRRQSAGNGASA